MKRLCGDHQVEGLGWQREVLEGRNRDLDPLILRARRGELFSRAAGQVAARFEGDDRQTARREGLRGLAASAADLEHAQSPGRPARLVSLARELDHAIDQLVGIPGANARVELGDLVEDKALLSGGQGLSAGMCGSRRAIRLSDGAPARAASRAVYR